jgi:hypothetical protein
MAWGEDGSWTTVVPGIHYCVGWEDSDGIWRQSGEVMTLSRAEFMANKLSREWGTPVIVQNLGSLW